MLVTGGCPVASVNVWWVTTLDMYIVLDPINRTNRTDFLIELIEPNRTIRVRLVELIEPNRTLTIFDKT